MDEAVPHSINPELFNMGAKIKHLVTPAAYEILARRKFVSHARHLKE